MTPKKEEILTMPPPDEPIVINGMPFMQVKGVQYQTDYRKVVEQILDGTYTEFNHYRTCVLQDLWFIVYFVMRVPIANCKFCVDACKDVQKGPKTNTLDLWAREHFKSTVITVAETIQRLLANPEERVCIFSYTRGAAMVFFRQIKYIFEQSEFLKHLFPDILYADPSTQAWKWSEDAGLYLRRKGMYKEASLEAWGLIEGMPTARHFSHRVYDDVVTLDLVNTPEIMEKCKQMFDMSENVGTEGGTKRVIGTPYHHEDALMYIAAKKTSDGTPIYHLRKKPATENGEPNGKSVYMAEDRLEELRSNKRMYYSQQLVDPTPLGEGELDQALLQDISPERIPKNLYKFMSVDPAGVRVDRRGDDWAIFVVGVKPELDDLGASDVYILDCVIAEMNQADALDEIVKMYLRNGRILRLGVEKVAQSTAEIHVQNALRAKGRKLSVESKTLHILRPAGRKKEFRIEGALSWPLKNGKLFMSTAIPTNYKQRIRLEMEKFPFWRDDALDALSYTYDMIKDYKFSYHAHEAEAQTPWYWTDGEGGTQYKSTKDGWMIV